MDLLFCNNGGKMKKILVDGKEITTNFGEKGMNTIVTGDDLPYYELHTKNFKESNDKFFKRLVSQGYTRIRFAEVSTRIRNFHDVVAYCR